MNTRFLYYLFKQSYKEFKSDKAVRLGAALAFYSIFSLGPMLLIIISVSGLFLGQDETRDNIINHISDIVGESSAQIFYTTIDNASKVGFSSVNLIFGIILLIIGATGILVQLKDALNTIWNIPQKKEKTIKNIFINRLSSLIIILLFGMFVTLLLISSSIISFSQNSIENISPDISILWNIINVSISFLIMFLMFSVTYKFLPDALIEWRDVWIGAAATSLLFTISKELLGFVISKMSISSAYGAASSFVVIILWIYFSAQIFLFGAELTKVFACKYGSCISSK